MADLLGRGRTFIGRSGSGYVEINVLGADEEGWITASVEVAAEVWRGVYRATFYSGELSGLVSDLEKLNRELTGTARLSPIEPFLELIFTGDGKGHITVDGKAQNRLFVGTMLAFRLELDQTELLAIIDSLKASEPAQG